MSKKPRVSDFPMWKTGGSFATAAMVALLIGVLPLALVFAFIAAVFLVLAVVAKVMNKDPEAADRPAQPR